MLLHCAELYTFSFCDDKKSVSSSLVIISACPSNQ